MKNDLDLSLLPPEVIEGAHAPDAHETASEFAQTELVDADAVFYAPVATTAIDQLLASYEGEKKKILHMAEVVNDGKFDGVWGYFLDGNLTEAVSRNYGYACLRTLMDVKGATAALDATYWSKALALTDVYESMPQARRNEWSTMIRENKAPAFEPETVRGTLMDLLNSRQRFFAERVDGVFRRLSREHATNSPSGFSKRLILGHCLDHWGYSNHDAKGHINDLRCLVGRFMGRGEPGFSVTDRLFEQLRATTGVWHSIDGGAIRIKLYKKGTAHIEIHPDMAWRLNMALASLYPQAIPSQFRTKPKAVPKEFGLMERPLPFAVLDVLAAIRPGGAKFGPNVIFMPGRESTHNAAAIKQAREVVEALGGVAKNEAVYEFDFDPRESLRQVVASGVVPDEQSHQFYPTAEPLAQRLMDELHIQDSDLCLEPSAGRGGLADMLPKDRTTCVEISALNCKVLEAKQHQVEQADFLTWAQQAFDAGKRFQKVAMNPPFSSGRAELHVKAAATLVAEGGRLCAIVPPTLKGRIELPGFDLTWSEVLQDQFAGTSVCVVILTADKVETE